MNARSSSFAINSVSGVLLLSTLLGCSTSGLAPTPLHRVESQREAGVTDVAVIYVEPWDVVAQSLAPNFDISAESALRQVIPNTSQEVGRFVDAMSFRFGLGLPGSTTTSERTETEKSGAAPTSQATTTQKTEPGKAPDLPAGSPAGDRTAKGLPGTDVLAREIAQEPVLRYKAAVALYQEVKMLNRYVQGAARGSDYLPYLVRLQITLMPYARNSPYDAYSNISFFTTSFSSAVPVHPKPVATSPQPADAPAESTPPVPGPAQRVPIVVPLVVTDAIEGSLTSNTTEILRQIGLALGGTVGNVGMRADAQSLQDALRSVSGITLNSLQTVSRLGENGIRVRLGAVKSPVSAEAYVMVPRTHNVTLLLLVPRDDSMAADAAPRITMAARSTFYDAIHGTRLPTFDSKNSHVKDLDDVAAMYMPLSPEKKFELPEHCDADQYQGQSIDESTPIGKKRRLLLYLMEQTQTGNIKCFHAALTKNYPVIREGYALWNEIAMLTNSYGFSGTSFQLPRVAAIEPPPSQTVMLMDDGKAAATALLRNGVALVPDRMIASLAVKAKNGPTAFEIPALSTSLVGSALRLTFPSFAKTGITEKGAFKDGMTAEIRISQRADVWTRNRRGFDFTPCTTGEATRCATYPVVLQGVPVATEPGVKFETAINTVPIRAGDNSGQMSVYLTFDGASSARIAATGGEIRTASLPNEKGLAGQALLVEGGVVSVPASAGKSKSRVEAMLSLGNLVDGGTLKLVVTGMDGKGSPTAEAPPLSIAIKRDQPAPKKDEK